MKWVQTRVFTVGPGTNCTTAAVMLLWRDMTGLNYWMLQIWSETSSIRIHNPSWSISVHAHYLSWCYHSGVVPFKLTPAVTRAFNIYPRLTLNIMFFSCPKQNRNFTFFQILFAFKQNSTCFTFLNWGLVRWWLVELNYGFSIQSIVRKFFWSRFTFSKSGVVIQFSMHI